MILPKLAPCHSGGHRFRFPKRCRPRVMLLVSCVTIPPTCAKGKVVLFEFWTTWCKYCEEEAHLVDDIAKECKSKNLIVLAVDVLEADQQVKKYLAEHPRLSPLSAPEIPISPPCTTRRCIRSTSSSTATAISPESSGAPEESEACAECFAAPASNPTRTIALHARRFRDETYL